MRPAKDNVIIIHQPADYFQLDVPDHHDVQPENQGSVSHEEGRVLAGLAHITEGHVLEVGADLGISTRYILDGLAAKPHRRVVSLDYFHKWPGEHPQRLKIDQDTRQPLHPIVAKLAPYAFAFIDGDHTFAGVMNDIRVFRQFTKTLVFHDCSPAAPVPTNPSNGSEARRAVIESFPGYLIEDIPTHCGLMIVHL